MPVDQAYVDAVRDRYKKHEAAELRAKADLAVASAEDNPYAVDAALNELENLTMKKAALEVGYQKYYAENTPKQVAPEREDAWREKRIEEMTPADALKMMNETSEIANLGGKLDFTDPNVQRGWVELQNRKSRGQ